VGGDTSDASKSKGKKFNVKRQQTGKGEGKVSSLESNKRSLGGGKEGKEHRKGFSRARSNLDAEFREGGREVNLLLNGH